MRTNKPKTSGVIYHAGILRLALVAVVLLLNLNFVLAEGSDAAAPHPSPTDAVKVSDQRLRVEGRAATRKGKASARYAALLDGYAALLKHGLENGLFPGSWGDGAGGFRVYRIDEHHPLPDVLSWVFRTKVLEERSREGETVLSLESASLGSLASARPELRAMVTQDVDRDGLSDLVGLGYDGSVYLLKSPEKGGGTVAARSPSHALLEVVSGPGYERVRAVLPQDLGSVEVVGPKLAQVLLKLELLEMVNGELMGRAVEHREVMLHLDGQADRIRFDVSEPPDFSRLAQSDVELRGTAISEKILEDVQIRHNDVVAWEAPEGIGIRALNFNLARQLLAGWNCFRITARDSDGFSSVREVWVEGPEVAAPAQAAAKRAVLVALDDDLDQGELLESLRSAGFDRGRVQILQAREASTEQFLDAVRQGGADELLLYCESFSAPGALVGGKSLRFSDGTVLPAELDQALEEGGYKKVVGLIYSELPREKRTDSEGWALWRDTSFFLEQLGQAGRLFVANVENPDENPRRLRKRSRNRLRQALSAKQGTDLSRLLDGERPGDTLFRGWMFGSPVMGEG